MTLRSRFGKDGRSVDKDSERSRKGLSEMGWS